MCDHAVLVSLQCEFVQGPDVGFLQQGQVLVVGRFLEVEQVPPLLPPQVRVEVRDARADVPGDVPDEVRRVCVQLELVGLQETCRRILAVHRILHRRFLKFNDHCVHASGELA